MVAVAWDLITTCLSWLLMAYALAGAAVFVFAIAVVTWHESIKPRLITAQEISRLADQTIAMYGDRADDAAYSELEAAWWRGDGAEQVKWKRVLKEIRRRDLHG